MPLTVVFMGTPEFAVPTLMEIVGQGHAVPLVLTRAPQPAGRGMAPRPSAVEEAARRLGLAVEHPASLKDPAVAERLAALGADVAVVVAYGMILPPAVLDVFPEGCLNLHASLLPRWRGAAPIQRAVMAGDEETGVAVMRMEAGLDTGPVAMVERVPIPPEATAGDLQDAMARLGADLMARALGAVERGALVLTPQPEEGVTYAEKISKAEARIDWSQLASTVHNRIRGLSPFPGAWCEAAIEGRTERLKCLRSALAQDAPAAEPGTIVGGEGLTVACGEGAVRLIDVQRAGRAPIDAEAFLRGARLAAGDRLG